MSDSSSPLFPPSPAGPEVTLESLVADYQALRNAFHLTLVGLLILTGSLFVFFLREVSLARRQVVELSQVVADYEKSGFAARLENFRVQLQSFTQTHPDFNPIYSRYFGTSSVSQPSPAPRSGPASNLTGPRLPPTPGR
jgi:hypothetical protein